MSESNFSFKLKAEDNEARVGKITTSKGSINTPAFMPVGTQGTLKGIFTDDLLKTKSEIILLSTLEKKSISKVKAKLLSYAT